MKRSISNLDGLLSKCSLEEEDLDFGEFNLDDPDEYDILEDSYTRINNYLFECSVEEYNKLILSYVIRYRRYLDVIDNWLGFDWIKMDIKKFLISKDRCYKLSLITKIDKVLYTIANKVRETGEILDNREIKKIKMDFGY